jgi:hypothetical protein
MRTNGIRAATAAFGLFVAAAGPARAGTIYADAFDRSPASGLNGAVPGTRSGADGGSGTAVWTASDALFRADGSVVNNSNKSDGSAALPFTPQAGRVYTLGADVDTTTGIQPSWIALGFEQFSSPVSPFNSSLNVGFAWVLLRSVRGAGQGQSFLGSQDTLHGDVGSGTHDAGAGTQSLKVMLDTTRPAWTAQWFVNDVSVRGPTAYATNPTIGFVGFSKFFDATGTVDNFSLTSVPEPGGVGLAVAAGVAGLLGRNRRRHPGG